MNNADESLAETLRRAGLSLANNAPQRLLEPPWFVKALMALAGWVAALFMLGFVAMGLAFIIEISAASAIVGFLLLGGAYSLLRSPSSDFVEHLVLAISLAGQMLVAWALISELRGLGALPWWLLALFQAGLAVVMPNFTHRVFSTFSACAAFFVAMAGTGAPHVAASLVLLSLTAVWLHEFRWPARAQAVHAAGYGLALGLLCMQYLGRFSPPDWLYSGGLETWTHPWMGEVLAGAALGYLLRHLIQRHAAGQAMQIAAYASVGILVLVSLQAHGLTQGAMVLVIGFAISNRLLMGLGVVSLLFSISSYYYLLDATLLTKAQILLVLGLLLLTARWLIARRMPASRGQTHD